MECNCTCPACYSGKQAIGQWRWNGYTWVDEIDFPGSNNPMETILQIEDKYITSYLQQGWVIDKGFGNGWTQIKQKKAI